MADKAGKMAPLAALGLVEYIEGISGYRAVGGFDRRALTDRVLEAMTIYKTLAEYLRQELVAGGTGEFIEGNFVENIEEVFAPEN
ncbi:hypothetical protein ACFLWE_00345 [Chloroflexota bacterium]